MTHTHSNENGTGLHIVSTPKFKTIHIALKFCAPLQRDTITKRALLPFILQTGTNESPSESALQQRLDDLYGAVLSIEGSKKGNYHIITVKLEIVNPKYVSEQINIVDQAIALLREIIYEPHTTENSFAPDGFLREKETLKKQIQAISDDKMSYANMRLIDEMCQGEAYALHIHGYESDLESLSSKDLLTYYETRLVEDQLDIYVLGDFQVDPMKQKIQAAFMHTRRQRSDVLEDQITSKKSLQVVHDKQSIQQAKLHLGYRTHCTFGDEDYGALQVLNAIYGGFPNSKLFVNVREKNSLAYYASSSIESHKGLLFVYSGISADDYEHARQIIEQQMDEMKKGQFSETNLKEAKQLINNSLLETLDHPNGIIELLYQQVIGHSDKLPKQLMENIQQVSKADVVAIAQKIEPDTVYLLTNKNGDTI